MQAENIHKLIVETKEACKREKRREKEDIK